MLRPTWYALSKTLDDTGMATENPSVRRAAIEDCDSIAAVHIESIRSLAARYYDQKIVQDWARPRTGGVYRRAMETGEMFFVAVNRELGKADQIVGFSSYRVDDGKHRTAVYVSGDCARKGVGTALLLAAESAARSQGAKCIDVAASLCALDFYRTNGFQDLRVGEHVLSTGRRMPCVFMRKEL